MSDCIFCKIIKGDIPSTNLYRDEQVTAFRTINLYKKGLERNNLTAEYNIWGNLLGFVPLGILLPLAIPFFRRWWVMIPAGFLVSLGFECLQLYTGLGVWDVDDLLLNTGGATAGYVLFVLGAWFWYLIYPKK